jgi:Immunoglobulin-like domain of bacterial spore germination
VKTLLILFIGLGLILSAACGDGNEDTGPDPTATATSARTSTPAGTAPTPTSNGLDDVCADNPDPATDETTQVDEPLEDDQVTSPLAVRGRVAAFEATFKITLFDEDKNELADVTGMSSEGQTLAPFEEEVVFSVTEETPACLWVYEGSARDGQPINVVQIPVILIP